VFVDIETVPPAGTLTTAAAAVPVFVISTELYPDNEYLTVTVEDPLAVRPLAVNAPVDELTDALPAVWDTTE
jgi:hypothetical protein